MNESEKIIDMKKVGDTWEQDGNPKEPDHDPFTEFVYTQEMGSDATATSTRKRVRLRPDPIPINPEAKRARALKNVKEVLDGAEVVASVINDVLKRVERLNKGK